LQVKGPPKTGKAEKRSARAGKIEGTEHRSDPAGTKGAAPELLSETQAVSAQTDWKTGGFGRRTRKRARRGKTRLGSRGREKRIEIPMAGIKVKPQRGEMNLSDDK